MQHVVNKKGGILFLDAPGVAGNTFFINLLLADIRINNTIDLAIASSGTAATFLPDGIIAHLASKLPLNLARTNIITNHKNHRKVTMMLRI